MSVIRKAKTIDREKVYRELLEIARKIDEYEKSIEELVGFKFEGLNVEAVAEEALNLLNAPIRSLKKVLEDEYACDASIDTPSCIRFYAATAVVLWRAKNGDPRAKKIVEEDRYLKDILEQIT